MNTDAVAGATPTAPAADEPVPLSARRRRRLEYHGLAAGALAVAAVVVAWFTVVSWAAELYRWPFAAHGFRSWLVAGGISLLFYLLLCAVSSNVFTSIRNAAAGSLVATHQPVGGLACVTALVCTVPRWADVAAAWQANTPAPLAAHWPGWLVGIAPAVLAGIVGHAAVEYAEYTGFRLEAAQHAERAETGQTTTGRDNRLLWTVMPGPRSGQ